MNAVVEEVEGWGRGGADDIARAIGVVIVVIDNGSATIDGQPLGSGWPGVEGGAYREQGKEKNNEKFYSRALLRLARECGGAGRRRHSVVKPTDVVKISSGYHR